MQQGRLQAKVEKELSNDFRLFKNTTTIEWLKMLIEEQEKLNDLYKKANPIITKIRVGSGGRFFAPISELECKLKGLKYLYKKKQVFYEKNKQNYYKN